MVGREGGEDSEDLIRAFVRCPVCSVVSSVLDWSRGYILGGLM